MMYLMRKEQYARNFEVSCLQVSSCIGTQRHQGQHLRGHNKSRLKNSNSKVEVYKLSGPGSRCIAMSN